jgi:hypothetical protein
MFIKITQIMYTFIELCEQGDLLSAQQCIQRNPNINNEVYNLVFQLARYNGHLHVVQWLLQVCPTINISFNNQLAFSDACLKGHLHMAQWLLQVCPTINIFF